MLTTAPRCLEQGLAPLRPPSISVQLMNKWNHPHLNPARDRQLTTYHSKPFPCQLGANSRVDLNLLSRPLPRRSPWKEARYSPTPFRDPEASSGRRAPAKGL